MNIKKIKTILYLSFVFLIIAAPLNADYIKELKKGIQMMNKSDYSKAEETFSMLINNEPDLFRAYIAMAVLKIKTSDFTYARDYLKKAVALDSCDDEVYYLLAVVEENAENTGLAIKYYNEFLSAVPDTPKKERILDKIRLLSR